ncbi:MAG: ArsR/SmtB family transcription factor [Promethearchaeota archaeon]
MKPVKIIRDPECCQLIGDETRRKIIFLLRAKPMSVSQIAETLELSPQTVYHHIQKLKKADMVQVVSEKRSGHLIESFYQSTAEVFNFMIGETVEGVKVKKELVKMVVNSLNKIGFDLEYDDKTAEEIVKVENKMSALTDSEEYYEKISGLEDVDLVTKQDAAKIAKRITMSDEEFEERLNLTRKTRDLYISMKKKK